jgi:hypothetical protein
MVCQVAPGRLTWDDGRFLVPKQQGTTGGRGVQPGLVDCCERDPPELSSVVSPSVRQDERARRDEREGVVRVVSENLHAIFEKWLQSGLLEASSIDVRNSTLR